MKNYYEIDGIPVLCNGEDSNKILIAVHGFMSNKEDTVINTVSDIAISKGYQVISMDLPEHGQRKDGKKLVPWVCEKELQKIYHLFKKDANEISVFACSIGAYMGMIALNDVEIKKSLFLSPIVNMEYIIDNMMREASISFENLKKERVITLKNGVLDIEYYNYVKNHPLNWSKETHILWGKDDNLMPETEIDDFAKKTLARVDKVPAEHYFYSPLHLRYLTEWAKNLL